MHAVSPVHVYVENHVKHPVTSFDVKNNLKQQQQQKKKGVKGTSQTTTTQSQTVKAIRKPAKVTTNKKPPIGQARTRSHSPSKHTSWIPPPGKATATGSLKGKRLDYDEIPERDVHHNHHHHHQYGHHVSSCTVCDEAKSRSRSRSSSKNRSNDYLNENHGHDESASNSSESSAASFNELLKIQQQKHRLASSSVDRLNNTNDTYTIDQRMASVNKPTPTPPPPSLLTEYPLKSSLKTSAVHAAENEIRSDLARQSSSYEMLLQKLIETEGVGNEIAKHLSALKDFLRLICNENQINSMTTKRLESDRDLLLKNLEIFETVHCELKSVFYDIKEIERIDFRRNQANDSLIKHIDGLEQENNGLKRLIHELERNVTRFGSENEQYKLENSALCNLRTSLEGNRAHLQKQLGVKESEMNRLNVKIKSLERKIESLKSGDGTGALVSPSGKEQANKKQFDLNPKDFNKLLDAQTKRFIDKMQFDLKQKDLIIKDLIEAARQSGFRIKPNEQENEAKSARSEANEAETPKDDKERIRSLENEVAFLKKELHESNNSVLHYKQQVAVDLDRSQSQTKDEEKRFELDKIKEKLQLRLTELEPLPELLKNTELRLHDAMKKLKDYEQRNADQSKMIENLQKKFEQAEQDTTDMHDTLKSSARKSARRGNVEVDSLAVEGLLSARSNNRDQQQQQQHGVYDAVEKRIKELEDENHELFRQLTHKDDTLRDANNRLAMKTNEASGLGRQLELALNEAKMKEDHIKEKYVSKERSLQVKCAELEAQLAKMKLEYSSVKRDREEIEYRHQSHMKDLRDRLEQANATNKSMQNYVNFLKNSYSSVFNDNLIIPQAMMPQAPLPMAMHSYGFNDYSSSAAGIRLPDNLFI